MPSIRFAVPAIDHRTPAAVAPVAAVAPAQPDGGTSKDTGHEHAAGHGHQPHMVHVLGHGPVPRPRRSPVGKTSRTRRRRRSGAPVEDDEIELPEADAQVPGVSSVGFQDDHPDGGNDQDEGERERSRHERLGRLRGLAADQLSAAPPAQDGAAGNVADERAVAAYLSDCCRLVAGWLPGDAAGTQIQASKLRLLTSRSSGAPLDQGGLARVEQHLRQRMPVSSRPSCPNLNLMLPLLVLQLQLPRSPQQLEEAIARVQARVWGAR